MKIVSKDNSRKNSDFFWRCDRGVLTVRAVLVLVLFAIWPRVYSQEPVPTPQIETQRQDSHPAKTNKKAAEQQRGTEKDPFVVKSIEAEKTPERAKQDAKEGEGKAANERGMLIWTIVLAVTTIVLAFVAGGQLAMFWKQLGLMKRAVLDGTKAAHAAETSAKATVAALTDLERPWLFVEAVRVERREGAPINPQIPNNWYVSFKWRNVGRAPALIKDCVVKIEDRDTLPPAPEYASPSTLVCPKTVSSDGTFETGKVGPAEENTVKNGQPIRLIVYGKLTYKELAGKVHHTGFAVEVSAHLPAHSTYENDAYEYYD